VALQAILPGVRLIAVCTGVLLDFVVYRLDMTCDLAWVRKAHPTLRADKLALPRWVMDANMVIQTMLVTALMSAVFAYESQVGCLTVACDGSLDVFHEVTEALLPIVHVAMDVWAGLVWE